MKAIVVTDQAAGTAGMKLVERPEPQDGANYGDVVVQVHASGFTGNELEWPSTWIDRLGRDRTPSIPGHELAGVVTALSYGTTGLSVGQRVFGLTDWTRDGTLAEYVAVEARNLAPLPGDVDFTVGAALVMSGLTAWQGLFEHGRLRVGQSVLVHGAAGVVGSMATQLAREAGAYVIGTGRASGRQLALDFGAQEFVDLDKDAIEDVGGVDLVFDVLGGEIAKRSAGVIRAGGTLVTITGPTTTRPRPSGSGTRRSSACIGERIVDMSNTITASVFYRTLNVEGLEIFYREAGPRDAPIVLLLHGFPSSSHMFRNLIPMLADTYHVVAPDFPGYGESSAPSVNDFDYSFERLATVTNSSPKS